MPDHAEPGFPFHFSNQKEAMYNIVYIVGAVVIIVVVLKVLGLF